MSVFINIESEASKFAQLTRPERVVTIPDIDNRDREGHVMYVSHIRKVCRQLDDRDDLRVPVLPPYAERRVVVIDACRGEECPRVRFKTEISKKVLIYSSAKKGEKQGSSNSS